MNITRFLCCAGIALLALQGHAQTKIAKEQIEDVFFLKEGGNVYGDVNAATSAIHAQQFTLETPADYFALFYEDGHAVIRSDLDLYLDPTNDGTAGAKIIPMAMMEFPDFVGDKIRFYSDTYSIGVSALDLDLRSDQNIKFHSDTADDLFVIEGDQGNVTAKGSISSGGDIKAGDVFRFVSDSEGDKFLLYGTLYRMAVSYTTLDFYSDQNFQWHSDSNSDAMTLDADTGRLTLSGPLQLPIYTSLPTGSVGEMIYYDHPSDNAQDGAYVKTGSGWVQL